MFLKHQRFQDLKSMNMLFCKLMYKMIVIIPKIYGIYYVQIQLLSFCT